MELLYLWINHSKKGIFQKQGINFSPEFNFVFVENGNKGTLSEDSSWSSRPSIFKTNVIENVTAVVGKNGVGKTTLLDYLSDLDCSMPCDDSYKSGYEKMRDEKKSAALCLMVFRDAGKIVIYHNFENGIKNCTTYEERNLSNSEEYLQYLKEQKGFRDILKIYITNSGYAGNQKSGFSTQGKLDAISLTTLGISTVAKTYYDKLLNLGQTVYVPSIYRKWREIIKKKKESMDFQKICDIVYFHKLFISGNLESYIGKVTTAIEVNCHSILRILENEYPVFYTYKKGNTDEEQKFYEYYSQIRKTGLVVNDNEDAIIINLIVALMFEACLELNIKFPIEINSFGEAKEWLIEKTTLSENPVYYEESLSEVEKLKALLDKAQPPNNVVPPNDIAYKRGKVFDFRLDSITYQEFINYVYDLFNKEISFALRYLYLDNLYMSSGERAFQNFFSWINLIPQFDRISGNVPRELKGTIMLLIDEIDLYLHPDWQKKFICLLLDEIEQQFRECKVQVIFATHSPLCLSDVPRENTVYLSKGDNLDLCKVDKREDHIQTFSKDLYSLLNDAFYLGNSTMGLYAKKYIDDIIRAIKKDESEYNKLCDKEIEELREKIRYIGNEVLQKKLLYMLDKCLNDDQRKLEILMQRRKELDMKIAELEEKND